MQTTFRVLIQKTVAYYPRFKQKTKWIELDFIDSVFSHAKVEANYPGWEVSMFWPK